MSNPFLPSDDPGRIWDRATGTDEPDRAADRAVRAALAAELGGEYDPETGAWRPSTWTSA